MPEYTIHTGDCLQVMPTLPADSVDTIITDPPYGLSFMGKNWDHGVPGVPFWAEALRVAKPGAFLLAFGGTRTFHRLACAIEDAGWEIRDTVMWVYAQGFPKSHNIDKAIRTKVCICGGSTLPYTHEQGAEPLPEHDLRPVQKADISSADHAGTQQGQVLQPCLPEQSVPVAGREQLPTAQVWPGQSGMEGRGDLLQEEGQLQEYPLCQSAGMGQANGAAGRLHYAAPSDNGRKNGAATRQNGSSASFEPRPVRQSTGESGIVAEQLGTQESGTRDICSRCNKPIYPEEQLNSWAGYGSALKPSFEPIIVAMKPLSGTFAQNALEHGVAGLWIDGARVGTFNDGAARSNTPGSGRMKAGGSPIGTFTRSNGSQPLDENLGRWPANLIHDGSDEVLAGFPESGNGSGQPTIVKRKRNKGWANSSPGDGVEAIDNYGDTGSAARFFYCAKASRRERNAGLEGMEARAATTYSNESEEGAATRGRRPRHDTPTQNFHPTVKPIALMRYLARLTKTPTGGVVLDPFMGSGSTGIGAILEGRDFIGIEQDAEYAEIADRRIAHWQAEAEPEQLQLV